MIIDKWHPHALFIIYLHCKFIIIFVEVRAHTALAAISK
jgi:hypothetical protein